MSVVYKSWDFSSFFVVSLRRLRIEASHMETIDSFCAARNRTCGNKIAPIHSGRRAGGNSKTGVDDLDCMFIFFRPPLCVRLLEWCTQMPRYLIAEIASQFFSLGPRIEISSERLQRRETNFFEPQQGLATFSMNNVKNWVFKMAGKSRLIKSDAVVKCKDKNIRESV